MMNRLFQTKDGKHTIRLDLIEAISKLPTGYHVNPNGFSVGYKFNDEDGAALYRAWVKYCSVAGESQPFDPHERIRSLEKQIDAEKEATKSMSQHVQTLTHTLEVKRKEYEKEVALRQRTQRESTDKSLRLNLLQRVLDRIFLGGNLLASALVGLSPTMPPDYHSDIEEARKKINSNDVFNIWVCWQAIMLARDEIQRIPPAPKEVPEVKPTFDETYGPWICMGCGYAHVLGEPCPTDEKKEGV